MSKLCRNCEARLENERYGTESVRYLYTSTVPRLSSAEACWVSLDGDRNSVDHTNLHMDRAW